MAIQSKGIVKKAYIGVMLLCTIIVIFVILVMIPCYNKKESSENTLEFLFAISSEVYFDDFKLWEESEVKLTKKYTGFAGNVCEMVYNGELCKVVYSGSGVVIVDTEDDFKVIYNEKILSVPLKGWALGVGSYDIFLTDLENDGSDELCICMYYGDRDSVGWSYMMRLEPLEFIEVSYSESSINEIVNYGIDTIEVTADGNSKVFFYIANNLGERITGDILLEGVYDISELTMIPKVWNIVPVNKKTFKGSSEIGIYPVGNTGISDRFSGITFNVSIKYDESKGEYYPESKEVRFNWTDSYGKAQIEGIRIDWN